MKGERKQHTAAFKAQWRKRLPVGAEAVFARGVPLVEADQLDLSVSIFAAFREGWDGVESTCRHLLSKGQEGSPRRPQSGGRNFFGEVPERPIGPVSKNDSRFIHFSTKTQEPR
jgi:hypothetical protein